MPTSTEQLPIPHTRRLQIPLATGTRTCLASFDKQDVTCVVSSRDFPELVEPVHHRGADSRGRCSSLQGKFLARKVHCNFPLSMLSAQIQHRCQIATALCFDHTMLESSSERATLSCTARCTRSDILPLAVHI